MVYDSSAAHDCLSPTGTVFVAPMHWYCRTINMCRLFHIRLSVTTAERKRCRLVCPVVRLYNGIVGPENRTMMLPKLTYYLCVHVVLTPIFARAGQLFLNQAQLRPRRVDSLRKAVPTLSDSDISDMQRCPYR